MSSLISNPAFRSLMHGIRAWAPLWISTTVLFGVLGLGYVIFLKQYTFLASQALLVRDEATGAVMRLGRFQSQTEMKAAQETILEMAKSQQVVRDALVAVGPPKGLVTWLNSDEYPTKELVEEVAKYSISVHAPKGTEFGVTEVIYMDVKANNQMEAMSLCKVLTEALESRLQQVRMARAEGVLAELTLARDMAKRELDSSTNQLHQIESDAGSDLSDLRAMTDSLAGAATLRGELERANNDLRQAEIHRQSLMADRELLVRATKDPTSFIVAPGAILNSQPGLKRLREGLVDAQLGGSQLTGKFTENHPSVIASLSAQSSIVKRFLQELQASIAGVESDLSLIDGQIQRLETQKQSAQGRLKKLADNRAMYANLISEVKSKIGILESSERDLAEVQAARESSKSTSLLTRLDPPTVSDRPIGPGKKTIVGLCTIAGFVFGLGIVFAVTPIDASPVFGRRSLDRARGRSDADFPVTNEPVDDRFVKKMHDPSSPQARPNSNVSQANVPPVNPKSSTDAIHPVPSKSDPNLVSSALPSKAPEMIRPRAKLNFQPDASFAQNATSLTTNVPDMNQKLSEAYQPLVDLLPNPKSKPKERDTQSNAKIPVGVFDVDHAFQELARCKLGELKGNADQEVSVKTNMQELSSLLSNQARCWEDEKETEEFPRMKPRPTTPKR